MPISSVFSARFNEFSLAHHCTSAFTRSRTGHGFKFKWESPGRCRFFNRPSRETPPISRKAGNAIRKRGLSFFANHGFHGFSKPDSDFRDLFLVFSAKLKTHLERKWGKKLTKCVEQNFSREFYNFQEVTDNRIFRKSSKFKFCSKLPTNQRIFAFDEARKHEKGKMHPKNYIQNISWQSIFPVTGENKFRFVSSQTRD